MSIRDRKLTDLEYVKAYSFEERMSVALEDLKVSIQRGRRFPDACDIASDTHLVSYNALQYAYGLNRAGEVWQDSPVIQHIARGGK